METSLSVSQDLYKSAFFYFEGIFYNDKRYPECRDLSRYGICRWWLRKTLRNIKFVSFCLWLVVFQILECLEYEAGMDFSYCFSMINWFLQRSLTLLSLFTPSILFPFEKSMNPYFNLQILFCSVKMGLLYKVTGAILYWVFKCLPCLWWQLKDLPVR